MHLHGTRPGGRAARAGGQAAAGRSGGAGRTSSCTCTVPVPAVGRPGRAQRRVQAVRSREYKHTFAMSVADLDSPALSQAPLATAEFLVVDTETNGLGGDRCELTEIGA